MLRQGQYLKQQQKLSPQQIQLMKLLQLPTTAIEQRIQEELEANPVLETGEDFEEPFTSTESESEADNEEKYADEAPDDFRDEDESIVREDEFELDDYLEKYIEDDPSVYKLKGENQSPDEEEKTIPIAVENSFH